jgi:hypothetical protein
VQISGGIDGRLTYTFSIWEDLGQMTLKFVSIGYTYVAHALRPIVPFHNRPDSRFLIDRFVPAMYTLLVPCFLKPPILDSRSRSSTPPSRKLGNYGTK